ncbi:hypothetical protein OKW29_000179 [Paraburkholderia sp. CI3]
MRNSASFSRVPLRTNLDSHLTDERDQETKPAQKVPKKDNTLFDGLVSVVKRPKVITSALWMLQKKGALTPQAVNQGHQLCV